MERKSIWDTTVSHGDLLRRVWKHLELGVKDRHHPFHTPVFATIGEGQAELRSVILRRFFKKPRELAFHAHRGSPKVKQVSDNPKVSWLFYHPEEKLQLRIRGIATVLARGEIADEQWKQTSLFGRRCYIGMAPSQQTEKPSHGMPSNLVDREPLRDESEIGRENFCVVSSTIDYIDCVELDVRGHRRCFFDWTNKDAQKMGWMTP
ncbi:MAG: pyridoxamine 5'-phosphate oxidase family protein [Pyrinomonadaceae bacterium]